MQETEISITPEPLVLTLAKPELPKVVVQHILSLMAIYRTDKAYFFGSRVRNLQYDWSDYDVAFSVDFEKRYKDEVKDSDYKKHVIDIVFTKDIKAWSDFVNGAVKMTKQELQTLLHS